MNKLQTNMRRFRTKNLDEGYIDVGKLVFRKKSIESLLKEKDPKKMMQIAKTIVDDLGGTEEAEETVLGALETTEQLIPVIKAALPNNPEPVNKRVMLTLVKALAPNKYQEIYKELIQVIKRLGVNIV